MGIRPEDRAERPDPAAEISIFRGNAEDADLAGINISNMELLYKNECEILIRGILKVYNALGYGYREKEYQAAYAAELHDLGIPFTRELYSFLRYNGKLIRKYFLDFLVELGGAKIVIELKVANEVYRQHFTQVLQYLVNNHIKLGLIFVITPHKVIIKRVINEASASPAKSAIPRNN